MLKKGAQRPLFLYARFARHAHPGALSDLTELDLVLWNLVFMHRFVGQPVSG
jgi:hypothetical protein